MYIFVSSLLITHLEMFFSKQIPKFPKKHGMHIFHHSAPPRSCCDAPANACAPNCPPDAIDGCHLASANMGNPRSMEVSSWENPL